MYMRRGQEWIKEDRIEAQMLGATKGTHVEEMAEGVRRFVDIVG